MWPTEPQRHSYEFGIRNSEFGINPHPPELFNAKTQRRKDAKATRPPGFQRRDAEAQRRRESRRRLHRVARSRPSNDGRVPLGRDTDSNVNVRHGVPTQRPALSKRRPRLFSSPLNSWEELTAPTNKREERQNRRANGMSAGEKASCDERSRSEQAGFSPATGDRLIACRSAVNKRNHPSRSVTASLRLSAFATLRSFSGGSGFAVERLRRDKWAALRLCDSAPLRFLLCVPLCVSVTLWFFVGGGLCALVVNVWVGGVLTGTSSPATVPAMASDSVSPREITVVAAVIRDEEGRVLLAQRPEGRHMGGLWEFPGGKIDDGEAPSEALVRELDEELGIEIVVQRPLTFAVHEEPGLRILLLFYGARIARGEPQGHEGQAVEWVAVTELPSFPTPPADAELIRLLADDSIP